MTLEEFLSRFESSRRSGSGYIVRCPAHEDNKASLSVRRGDRVPIILKCQAGCKTEAVVSAMGLTMADLQPDKSSVPGWGRVPSRRSLRPTTTSTSLDRSCCTKPCDCNRRVFVSAGQTDKAAGFGTCKASTECSVSAYPSCSSHNAELRICSLKARRMSIDSANLV